MPPLSGTPVAGFIDTDLPNGRHNNGDNVAFCDGHVKWLTPSTILGEARKGGSTPQGAWNPNNF